MDDRFSPHIARLLADAEREAAAGDWKAARALAEAALSLDGSSAEALRLVRRAETAVGRGGERRQLTVLFSDVVGSTALSSRADPEVVRDILRSYQASCADVVAEYDGHIAAYVGDGIVAYFGYPQAHEDDPSRAVRAGLALLEATGDVSASVQARFGLSLAIRVAVHTGLVVRAEMGSPRRRDVDAVVGVTPNVAARLQEHARPGTLLISGDTHDLLRGSFAVRPVGPVELRGIPAPVTAYEVVGEQAEQPVARAPFCGRRTELALLQDRWAVGGPTVLTVSGESGIGKSRLAEEFRQWVEASGGRTLRCQCSSYHTATALYPARQLVAAACEIDTRDPVDEVLPALRGALGSIDKDHLLGVFADFLGLAPSDGWEPPELDGPRLREVTLSTLVSWLSSVATDAPTLIVVDDLQWADPTSMELIDRIVQRGIDGLLILATARDEFTPPWEGGRVVHLDPLPEADAMEMARGLPEAEDLTADVLDGAVRRSGGVPLFVEELVRVADAEPVDLATDPEVAVPPVLIGPLLARLAAPGVDLGLCQALASVGREADREVLAALLGLPDDLLDAKLRKLVEARLLELSGGDHPSYRFRHDLLRDLAYGTLLRPERRRLHSAIADIVDALDVHGVPGDSGVIAYHLERAGRIADSVGAYISSARQSLAHGAMAEAIDQLDLCLKLLDEVADERRRNLLELTVREVRGMAWVSSRGYGSRAAVEDFQRCVELSDQLGADADPVPGIEAIWYYYLLHGELDRAERLMIAARRGPHSGGVVPEEGVRSPVRFFRGDFIGAIADMNHFLGSAWAEENDGVIPTWPLPDDPIINVGSFLGMAQWIAGDPAAANRAFARARERAARLGFPHGPFGAGYVLQLEVTVTRLAGLHDEATRLATELEALGSRHGFGFFQAAAYGDRLIGEAFAGAPASTLDGVVEAAELMGLHVWTPYFRMLGAAAALAHGDHADAARRAEAAMEAGEATGVRFVWAEACRVRGAARVAGGDTAGTEDLERAVAAARGQGAKMFELRALIDLGDRTRLADAVAAMDAVSGLAELDQARALLGRGVG